LPLAANVISLHVFFAPPTLDCAPAYVTRHCLTGRFAVGAAVQTYPLPFQTLPLSRPSCIGHTLALESNDHLRLRLSGHSQPSWCLSHPPSGPIPMRVFGIVCLNDHSHYLNFRPGFRSLSCFLARACHDLIWNRYSSIRFPPPSPRLLHFPEPTNSAPDSRTNSTALLVRPHFRFRTHIRYLACIQSLHFTDINRSSPELPALNTR
jgi:hypothetical protein